MGMYVLLHTSGLRLTLTQGGTMYAWTSYQTLLPLILGAVGIAAWLVYERVVPARPILPLTILNNRTAAICFIGTLLMGIVQFGQLYFLPLYYQVRKEPGIYEIMLIASSGV